MTPTDPPQLTVYYCLAPTETAMKIARASENGCLTPAIHLIRIIMLNLDCIYNDIITAGSGLLLYCHVRRDRR